VGKKGGKKRERRGTEGLNTGKGRKKGKEWRKKGKKLEIRHKKGGKKGERRIER